MPGLWKKEILSQCAQLASLLDNMMLSMPNNTQTPLPLLKSLSQLKREINNYRAVMEIDPFDMGNRETFSSVSQILQDLRGRIENLQESVKIVNLPEDKAVNTHSSLSNSGILVTYAKHLSSAAQWRKEASQQLQEMIHRIDNLDGKINGHEVLSNNTPDQGKDNR